MSAALDYASPPPLPEPPVVAAPARPGPRVLETLAAIVVALVLSVAIAKLSGWSLLSRVMWNDEYITHRIQTQPPLFRPFTNGVEMNLPLYPLVLKAFGAVTLHRFAPPFGYRLLSLAFAALAGAGVYAGLRHRFCRLTSTIGALLVLSMPTTIEYAYEARYYAMLLAGTAWLATLQLRVIDAPTRLNRVGLVLLAAIVTSSHWFGILAPASIVLAVWIASGFRPRRTIAATWPTLLGSCVILAWLPLYVAQRRVMGGVSWINPNLWQSGTGVVVALFENAGVAFVAIVGALAAKRHRETTLDVRTVAPLAGPLLVPALLLVASVIVQPMMVTRYAVETVAGLGLVAALLIHRAPTWARIALALALVATIAVQTAAFNKAEEPKFAGVRDAAIRLRQAGDSDPIYFDSIHLMSPFMQLARKPELDRAIYIGDPVLDRSSPWYKAQRVQQTFNQKTWGWPTIATMDAVTQAPSFWLVGGDVAAQAVRDRMPGSDVRMITPTLFRVTPRGATTTARPATAP